MDDLKKFGYHPASDYGRDVMKSTVVRNVDVEIEYSYVGSVIGIFIRERPESKESRGI